MWSYQRPKDHYREMGEVASGFTSRYWTEDFAPFACLGIHDIHFFAEQCIWTIPYFCSLYMTGKLFNWTVIGSLMYICLIATSSTCITSQLIYTINAVT
ncbi:hypothetical protein V1506DRAFT_543767 [Lipomyces tetrasporus]